MKLNNITPLKAIRLKCIDCCNGNKNEVKKCPIKNCPLYIFKLGKTQKDKEVDTQEELDKR